MYVYICIYVYVYMYAQIYILEISLDKDGHNSCEVRVCVYVCAWDCVCVCFDWNQSRSKLSQVIWGRCCVPKTLEHIYWSQETPPPGGFLFTMFPNQEPGGRGPPRSTWYKFFEGGPLPLGSWWGNILYRKPPQGGGPCNQYAHTQTLTLIHFLSHTHTHTHTLKIYTWNITAYVLCTHSDTHTHSHAHTLSHTHAHTLNIYTWNISLYVFRTPFWSTPASLFNLCLIFVLIRYVTNFYPHNVGGLWSDNHYSKKKKTKPKPKTLNDER